MIYSNNLSFIIVNYNGQKYIEKLLTSIQSQTYSDFDVFIIDNNSSDLSVGIIKTHSLYHQNKIYLCQLKKNTGYALGNNIGIKNTKSKYIALINNDVVLDSYWSEKMISLAESDEKIGIITSKVLFHKNHNIINSAGVRTDDSAMPYNVGIYEHDKNQYDVVSESEAFYGAAGFLKRTVINDVGYFNKYYFMYQEEYDLSVRARSSGWNILYNPHAVAYHFHSASAGKYSPKKTYFSVRNYVINTYKYLNCIRFFKAHKSFLVKVFYCKDSNNEKVVLEKKKKIILLFFVLAAYISGSVYGVIKRYDKYIFR